MNDIKLEIKKLTKEMEINQCLSYELSGCMNDKTKRDIFKQSAKHKIIPKKKYTYIDNEASGKFLVQNIKDKIAQKGYVWGIRAYGQKGRPVGMIPDVIKKIQKDNESLKKGVMERALKRRRY